MVAAILLGAAAALAQAPSLDTDLPWTVRRAAIGMFVRPATLETAATTVSADKNPSSEGTSEATAVGFLRLAQEAAVPAPDAAPPPGAPLTVAIRGTALEPVKPPEPKPAAS